jgi:hypothetical protein
MIATDFKPATPAITKAARAAAWASLSALETARAATRADQAARHALAAFLSAAKVTAPSGESLYSMSTQDMRNLALSIPAFRMAVRAAEENV